MKLTKSSTFLLDLDNTLLGNPMSTFLPAYFSALNKRLSPFLNGQDLRQAMIASVQVVLANHDPNITNYTVFTNDLLQRINAKEEVIQPLLDAFYQEDYPLLQKYTTTRPEARLVVEHLLNAGHTVVVATNPLFPAVAIEQRLAWAGVADLPFALVTTMENSAFCKPNPQYYRYTLNTVSAQPETSWMVGDDLMRDIAPAQTLGMKTWWITHTPASSNNKANPEKQGTLADFLSWLQSN